MKRWINLAARLYPASWRNRYATEFQALIDDVNPGWRELVDVLKGALKMRLTNGATYLKLGAAFALFGTVAAIATSYLVQQTYVSTAELRLIKTDADTLARIESRVLSRTSLSEVIQRYSLNLYRNERAHQPLEDVIETMRTRDLNIRIENPTTLSISFAAHDPRQARAVVWALMTRFIEESVQEHKDSGDPRNIEVLKNASLPDSPVAPNRLVISLIGIVAGLIIGLLAAIFLKLPGRAVYFAAFALSGFLLGAAISLRIEKQYAAKSVIRVAHYDATFKNELSGFNQPGFRYHVITGSPNQSTDLELEFRDRDPKKAAEMIRSITGSLTGHYKITERWLRYSEGPGAPMTPVVPNRIGISLLGLSLGLIAALSVLNARRSPVRLAAEPNK